MNLPLWRGSVEEVELISQDIIPKPSILRGWTAGLLSSAEWNPLVLVGGQADLSGGE